MSNFKDDSSPNGSLSGAFANDLPGEFAKRFGGSSDTVRVFAAPARINLIGEHIDYNGGKVFPVALDRYLYAAIRKRNDDSIIVRNMDLPGEFRTTLGSPFVANANGDYVKYLNGILFGVQKAKGVLGSGFEMLLFSTVPMGAGVSSSAALELCFSYALSELYGLGIDRLDLVKISQKAEHDFAGVQCGIMDQFAVAFGKKDNAILLDTASLEYELVPLLLGDYRIVLMNSNKPRALADSKYNERLAECRRGLAELQNIVSIKNLCELSNRQFEEYSASIGDETVRRRVRHCVSENVRVLQSVDALKAGDLRSFGKLMCESHCSLRDDYEVSGSALDALYDEAMLQEGCLGARMTGAGFGGCAIALVHKDRVDAFIREVALGYMAKTSIEARFYIAGTGEGAHEIS